MKDISVSDGITVSKQITITSNDSDDPCIIKNITQDTDDRKERGRIFTVNGGPLWISNVILDGGMNEGVIAYHPLICINNARVDLMSGAVLQNSENASSSFGGGAVNVRLGQVIMYDGAIITNCKAENGGGIEIKKRWRSLC